MHPQRVAIVTGARRGLGEQICRELVRGGFQVATCARSPEPPQLGEALHRGVDVADPDSVKRFVGEVLGLWGRIDVLVNNAGVSHGVSPLQETDDAAVQESIRTNLLGPYFVMKQVLPVMLRQPEGGVVVNVASRAGITPVPGLAAYSASKAGLVALTLAAAKELRNTPVFVASVCPGGMRTNLRADLFGEDNARTQQDPNDVAGVVIELIDGRTVKGHEVPAGSSIVVSEPEGIRVIAWPTDERGFEHLVFE
ncbi:MAG: SDR family oxidoreductase [Thermoplasmata archaeon]